MPTAFEREPLATTTAHLQTLGGDRADAIMQCYSEEPLHFPPEGLFRESGEIRKYSDHFMKTRLLPGAAETETDQGAVI